MCSQLDRGAVFAGADGASGTDCTWTCAPGRSPGRLGPPGASVCWEVGPVRPALCPRRLDTQQRHWAQMAGSVW